MQAPRRLQVFLSDAYRSHQAPSPSLSFVSGGRISFPGRGAASAVCGRKVGVLQLTASDEKIPSFLPEEVQRVQEVEFRAMAGRLTMVRPRARAVLLQKPPFAQSVAGGAPGQSKTVDH